MSVLMWAWSIDKYMSGGMNMYGQTFFEYLQEVVRVLELGDT